MEERKFVCKYCSKRFPCGKSLGGHIRTHMNEERSNADKGDDLLKLDGVRKRKRDSWPEAGAGAGNGGSNNNHPIYGLRENPKKTTRFVHIDAATLAREEERFCKECGKGFPSLKALCGHMACHSEKEKATNTSKFKDCEDQKLVMDSQSDTESCGAPTHPRRSKRMRFKNPNLSNQPSSSSVPLGNGSSSVSEVEQEQEEVARLLMMLSRDSGHKGRFALVTESDDNNSVVLEATKSPSPEARVAKSNGSNFVSNAYGMVEKKLMIKDIKFKCADDSDSGYFRDGLKTKVVESDVSNDEFKGWNVRGKSGFEDFDVESKKVLSRGRGKYTVAAIKNLDYDRTDETTTRKFDFRKRANYDSLGQNLAGVSSKKTPNGFTNDEIYENGGKGWKYEGMASEYDGSYDSIDDESDENSTDTDSFPAPKSHNNKTLKGKKCSKAKKKKMKSKKSREHECPICYRIFRSGQALGGHKRSHFIGGYEENTLIIKQHAPAVPCLIDLNLPAPVDD